MSNKKYNLAIFIGRMQPLHNGHIPNISHALELADHVLVIAGSANQPRTQKNPFTADERAQMIKQIFPTDRVQVIGVEDYYPDALWFKNVQSAVHQHIINTDIAQTLGCYPDVAYCEAKIAILGHDKDQTSYYLEKFPNWKFIEIGERLREEDGPIIDATHIRDLYFAEGPANIGHLVPQEVLNFMTKFYCTDKYKRLVGEQEYELRYKKEWEIGSPVPYPVTFTTTDAVVVQSGHVLLVKRRTEPGKGLWALPGGFIGQYERLEDSVIRELREETRLKVPVPVLQGSIKHKHTTVFDEPNRSLRGRTITHAFLIDLKAQPKLPKVKGADDAEEARWFPLDIVDGMGEVLFEDHKSIIQTMVAKLED